MKILPDYNSIPEICIFDEVIAFLNVKVVSPEIEKRHDTCVALRIPLVIEAARALLLADLMIPERLIGRKFPDQNRG